MGRFHLPTSLILYPRGVTVGVFSKGILAISRLIWGAQVMESKTLILFQKIALLSFALFDSFEANLEV